ncbi:cytochrome c biogenesis protein CcsA [Thiomicrospira microaerophila]|uniref:cytochrome C assembly family protein n=1 Tax=Thiomicrospira microaerophila TaxID=406020 RepID=UPI00200F4C07|nr:cytochrome c biogenesis protein CcsA [Thiomicrospira microaerophila]UQB42942.1 cytochrome c biogenesis protein CcsA [Thiomicrospira microaerophila]
MISSLSALMASLLYLMSTYYLSQAIRNTEKNTVNQRVPVLASAAFGLVLHTIALTLTLFNPEGMVFSFGNGLSLIGWIGVFVLLIISLNKPTESLGIFIFPLAASVTLLPMFVGQLHSIEYTLGFHVVISIFAYSVLGLATAQAILFSIQEKRFQKRKLTNLIRSLPPLQVMEKTLIQLVILGFIILSVAILSGAYFIENFFDQKLAHKTFFSILAWITYGLFLAGHFQLGWRGQKAARYTIWAYSFLAISYLGTQGVLLAMSVF